MKLVLRVIIANILARAITKVLDPLQEYWAAIDSVANPFLRARTSGSALTGIVQSIA
jgi:hypothetical protein